MRTDAATTLRPTDLAGAREAILDSGGRLLFRGGGTKLDWGVDPAGVDVVIDTTGMADLLTYDAADATVSVQAGMRLADLQRTLAEHDQWLAIDPPHVDQGATIGGILAADDAGPRRLAHGTMRDLVIGATYVLSDGAVGRTGGFVIKNVAGYDMAKLLCGSLGTLGLVAEVVLRVHPRPAMSTTLRVAADAASAARIGAVLGGAPIEPVAVDWADGALLVRISGARESVAAQVDRATALLRDHAGPGTTVDPLTGGDEYAVWRDVAAGLAGADGETVLHAGCRPTDLPDAVAGLVAEADEAGVTVHPQAHVLVGVVTARVSGGGEGAHAACAAGWRRHLRRLDGHVVARRRADGITSTEDVWGPAPSGIELMRRVKGQLDRDARCAPGRFVGGI